MVGERQITNFHDNLFLPSHLPSSSNHDSNISAGNEDQISHLMDQSTILQFLYHEMRW